MKLIDKLQEFKGITLDDYETISRALADHFQKPKYVIPFWLSALWYDLIFFQADILP